MLETLLSLEVLNVSKLCTNFKRIGYTFQVVQLKRLAWQIKQINYMF